MVRESEGKILNIAWRVCEQIKLHFETSGIQACPPSGHPVIAGFHWGIAKR